MQAATIGRAVIPLFYLCLFVHILKVNFIAHPKQHTAWVADLFLKSRVRVLFKKAILWFSKNSMNFLHILLFFFFEILVADYSKKSFGV